MSSAQQPVVSAFDSRLAAQVLELDETCAHADLTAPLDDQVRIDVESPSSSVSQWVVRDSTAVGPVLGYAHLDLRSADAAVAHLAVTPERRRAGVGTQLLHAVRRGATDFAELRLWAHGDIPAAQGFAVAHSLTPVRQLLRMRLPADVALAEASYPEEVTVRTFSPGDESRWVGANAEAFASHPEQGRLTVDDFRQRAAQPWFDPQGLFMAERDGKLLGFHWTKLQTETSDGAERRVGEIYVLGVRPGAQGSGLGKALTLTGLRYLRNSGADDIILYVEGDNAPALAVYGRFGFETASVDVMYAVETGSLHPA